MSCKINILFIVPYPFGEAPSQRFRFEQYLHLLQQSNIAYDFHSFYDLRSWKILYKKGFLVNKIIGIIKGFLKRIFLMIKAGNYNYVFIHREAAPLGPPIFEWILAKILRKKIIYDFDDAIWLPATSIHNRHVAYFKWNKKVAYICKWSYKISCGNAYLAEFAKKYNNNVIINPTTIDTENLHIINDSMQKSEDIPILGWTGTHSTIPYLKLIESALQKLEVKHSFILQVISNQPPDLNLSRLNYIEWNKLTEIQDLQNIDIGLMPLNEDKWSQGKCGFKSLQYMALAIPALVSPVGVNKDIIEHGENGFHCKNEEDWIQYIEKLITDKMLRKKMGVKGRIKVVEQFSILSNKENFLKLVE